MKVLCFSEVMASAIRGRPRDADASYHWDACLRDWEMDHSLQPICRTLQNWVDSGADVDEQRLLHLLYAVEPAVIQGQEVPAAVVMRCKRCHATWKENHGEQWQLRKRFSECEQAHLSDPDSVIAWNKRLLEESERAARCLDAVMRESAM